MKRGEREVIGSRVGFNSRDDEFSHAEAVTPRLEVRKLHAERDCHQ